MLIFLVCEKDNQTIMTNNKNILLIGRSGRGKSTLANVLTNTSNFTESSGSTSETRVIQYQNFANNNTNCQVIDTPGIGDTKLPQEQVLDIIAQAVYLAREGVSQVLFVTNGRFDQFEMATYNVLREVIFDAEVTKHTTIVRTNFPEFRDQEETQKDIQAMTQEAHEEAAKLNKKLATKEQEQAELQETSQEYSNIAEEIAKIQQELKATNLAEIIQSCQGRVVHVDNPSLALKGNRKAEIIKRTKKRYQSQEILLTHLNQNCQESLYQPSKLQSLSNQISTDYSEYLTKKEELERELKRLRSQSSPRSESSHAIPLIIFISYSAWQATN
jgi:GTP-binding protein EngB required for normal cell division